MASTRFNKIEISKTRKKRINWIYNATWWTVKKARSTPETQIRSPTSSRNSCPKWKAKVPQIKAITKASKTTAEAAVTRTTTKMVNYNVKTTTPTEAIVMATMVSVEATKTNKFNRLFVKLDPQFLTPQVLSTRFSHLQPVMLPLQFILSPTSSTALLSLF
jgi:hypothetical protein